MATAFTGLVGPALKYAIEKIILGHIHQAEVELLFGNLPLMAAALASVGALIIYAGLGRRASVKKASWGAGPLP